MTGFVIGIIFSAVAFACNDAAKTLMVKIHENDAEELAKMKIPGYPIYSYFVFKRKEV